MRETWFKRLVGCLVVLGAAVIPAHAEAQGLSRMCEWKASVKLPSSALYPVVVLENTRYRPQTDFAGLTWRKLKQTLAPGRGHTVRTDGVFGTHCVKFVWEVHVRCGNYGTQPAFEREYLKIIDVGRARSVGGYLDVDLGDAYGECQKGPG
jgi:hypothetical protein